MSAGLEPLRGLMTAYAHDEPVRKVAVVGNAPMVASAARAAEIDSADLVIRVNSFVLDRPDSAPCQGSRADVVVWSRLVNATPCLFAGYRERLYVLLEPMRMYGRPEMWPQSWPRDLGFVVARNDSVAIPLDEEIGLPWRTQPVAPTTGTTAAWLVINLFPSADVVLTGLSILDEPDQIEWRHQWGDSVGVGPEHRIGAEAALVRSWLDAGRARFLSLALEV
ncbi:MAG: glycosyltransferase family 29 protein [Actinomycetota bacterium]|nr:glycosyltransferase family 29 protein [Actinomycetota bacterium]